MKRQVFSASALLIALLSGCSANHVADSQWRIVPIEQTRHAMSRGEAMYQTGRYFHGQIRYAQAIDAYRKALEENPDHVDALNAMGVSLSNIGKHVEAERAFHRAIALAPDAAYLFNNLGYSYLRVGRIEEGHTALARALDLAPQNARYAANFSEATAALVAHRQATSFVATPSGSTLAPGDPSTNLPRVEISNGNGIRGMAARTASLLRDFGLPVSRLTNDRPYRQAQTEIQYLAGREAAAQRIGEILPVDAEFVQMDAMQRRIEVRVVIGHDLAGRS